MKNPWLRIISCQGFLDHWSFKKAQFLCKFKKMISVIPIFLFQISEYQKISERMSEKKEEFVFDIEEPTEKFTKHLSVSFNDRIVLSAPFGAGKTYFLKEYFKKNNDSYDVIHLFPVNYSVASSEDIFELIKFDILFELFRKDVEFDKSEFTQLDYLPLFFNENVFKIADVFTPLLSVIPKVGKSIYDIKENLKELFQEFQKKYKQIKTDDKQSVLDYIEGDFNQKKGNVYEDDFYSQLIRQLVEQLHGGYDGKPEKETVLIIDDLDRIDPHHIFRILNVLSAHMDIDSSENKFGFDKIVLVFDQYNVRNIFKNRYGTDVDFTGYIDKFYSYKIFEFSNNEGLQNNLAYLLKSIHIAQRDIDFEKEDDFIKGVVYILNKMIQSNSLTIRRLKKVLSQRMEFEYNFLAYKDYKYDPTLEFENKFKILFLAELLLFIYEDWDILLEATKAITKLEYNDDISNSNCILCIINQSILFLDYEQHDFQEKGYTFHHKEVELAIDYEILKQEGQDITCFASFDTLENGFEYNLYNPKLMLILYDTLKKIRDQKILKHN